MTDLEELLRQDGARFRAGAPRPPDLAMLLADLRRPAQRRPSRRTWLAGGLAVAAASVAVFVAFTLVSGHPEADRTPAAPTPAPSITVSGTAVPYLGPAPWNGAISDPTDPNAVLIDADLDLIPGVCGVPDARATMTQDADRVSILVAGYAAPPDPALACAGVGHAPLRIRIELAAPLDARDLVDASDGKIHPVLDPATVPTLTPPAGYTENPLSWDDREPGQFTRSWSPPALGPTSSIRVTVTPAANVDDHGAPDSPVTATGVPVGSSTATVWHSTDIYNDRTLMRWPVAGGRIVQLDVGGQVHSAVLSQDQIVALARTVVVP